MSGRRSALVAGGLTMALVAVVGAVVLAFVAASDDGPTAPSQDSVDVGFLRDMADHHEQAVRMSLLVIPLDGVSPAVRDVAVGVIASQRHDLGRIEAWLGDWDVGRGSPTRDAMAWRGHPPVAPSAMPGMATKAELDALGAASGVDAEVRFLDLMTAHHRAGVTMAEEAAEGATTAKVQRLAQLIAAGQREEILELQSLRRQLATSGTLDVSRAANG